MKLNELLRIFCRSAGRRATRRSARWTCFRAAGGSSIPRRGTRCSRPPIRSTPRTARPVGCALGHRCSWRIATGCAQPSQCTIPSHRANQPWPWRKSTTIGGCTARASQRWEPTRPIIKSRLSRAFGSGESLRTPRAPAILEALRADNGQVRLILYSRLGLTNSMETAGQLRVGGTWEPLDDVVASNLFNHLPTFSPLGQQRVTE
jgi:hypothetical protein